MASSDGWGQPASETRPNLWREKERGDETHGLGVVDLWHLAMVEGGQHQKLDRICGEKEKLGSLVGVVDLGGDTLDL